MREWIGNVCGYAGCVIVAAVIIFALLFTAIAFILGVIAMFHAI